HWRLVSPPPYSPSCNTRGGAAPSNCRAEPTRKLGNAKVLDTPGVWGSCVCSRQAQLALQLPQPQPVDGVVGVLAQHQRRTRPRRQDVLNQVGPVDGMPDVAGGEHRGVIGQRCVVVEVRGGIGERRRPQAEEPVDVPLLDVLDAGVDVHGEIEQVRHHQRRTRLQHVEALKNKNVGMFDDLLFARNDVVEQMRVNRCADLVGARLDGRHEPHQRAPVVALRETFAVHQVSTRQLGVRVQEAVGGDQVDLRVVPESRQKRLQHTGGGGLAHGDASCDADDERHRPVRILLWLTEELRGRGKQPLARRDLKVDQPGERQVDLFDLERVEFLAEAAKLKHLVFGQLHRRRHAQRAPLTPVELHVGARLAQPRHGVSLAFTVEAMDAATLIREYLLLGLRFARIEEGYVDSFTGDPGLRKQVQNEPAPDPADLATGAEWLAAEVPLAHGLDPARADYLTAHLRALACAGRKFAGQDVGFVDEVAAYFDVHIAKGDPERYRQAHFELDSALGGSGPLA